jgi:hypothetical protein
LTDYVMSTAAGPDDAERAAVDEARARVVKVSTKVCEQSGSSSEADQRALAAAWDDLIDARRSSFPMDAWVLGECFDSMLLLGMLTTEPGDEFPDLETYGLSGYPLDPDQLAGKERARLLSRQTNAERAYLAAARLAREADAGQPGIPGYKLSSPDGWLVTSREIKAALAAYQATPTEEHHVVAASRPWWPKWVAFLEHAKDQGGFHVKAARRSRDALSVR